jgi:hypothetical protein
MKSTVVTGAAEFQDNRTQYLARIADLQKRRAEANAGGSAKARALHRSRLSATDHSVNTPRSVTRWWGSAGALVRLTAPLVGGLMLDLDAGVDFPFVTRRFITTTETNQPVGATTSVSPTLAVGLSHSL